MKILIITYSYMPHLTPRALRWSAIASQWAAAGIDVEVICSWDPGSERQEIKDGVKIHRVGGAWTERLRQAITRRTAFNIDRDEVLPKDKRSAGASGREKDGLIRRAVKWIYDHTWKKLYWPDYACLWYFPARASARRLVSRQQHDAVITVSPPFTGHLVGLDLKRRHPKIKWIVDSGDPFCFVDMSPANNLWLYRRLNYRIEDKVFSLADVLTVTTRETAAIYAEIFPQGSGKMQVIPPVLNAHQMGNTIKQRQVFADNKTILAYIGNFHKRIREPDALLELMEHTLQDNPLLRKRLELHFFGGTDEFHDMFARYDGLNGICRLHGRASRSRVAQAILEADILVNIGNSTSYQLPSKLVEYASSGKPILNIYSFENDSSVNFLKDYPLALNLKRDSYGHGVVRLSEFIENTAGQTVDASEVERFIQPYRVDRIADQYLTLAEEGNRDNGIRNTSP